MALRLRWLWEFTAILLQVTGVDMDLPLRNKYLPKLKLPIPLLGAFHTPYLNLSSGLLLRDQPLLDWRALLGDAMVRDVPDPLVEFQLFETGGLAFLIDQTTPLTGSLIEY